MSKWPRCQLPLKAWCFFSKQSGEGPQAGRGVTEKHIRDCLQGSCPCPHNCPLCLSCVDTGQVTYQLNATLTCHSCPHCHRVPRSGCEPRPPCSPAAWPPNLPPTLQPQNATWDPDHATLFLGQWFPNACPQTGFGASPEVRFCSLSTSWAALGKFQNLSEPHCPFIRCRREIATIQGHNVYYYCLLYLHIGDKATDLT